MSSTRELLSRAGGIFRKNRTNYLQEELGEHIELLTADYVRAGMSEAEARGTARRALGNLTRVQEDYHEQNGLPLLENIWRDLKFALRTLRRNLVYSTSCITTLAVGLGSMITVLCVASALLWTPLPYPNAQCLVAISEADPHTGRWPFSEPDLLDLQERSKSLSAVAGYRAGALAMTGAGEPETVQAAAVTSSTFALFGIKPIAGQVFQDSQKRVVISPDLWRRKWQMNAAALGKAIALDGEQYTISGVADLPADLLPGVELFFPLSPRATESRTAHDIEVVGRLRERIALGNAQAELNAVADSIARDNPATNTGWKIRTIPLFDFVLGPRTGRMVWMIFSAVALFWALACANVAGLQLARSIARRHEMSTRLVLGASRSRLFAQTLTESLVLALGGAVFGYLLAQYAIEIIRRLAAETFPRLGSLHLDAKTIAIAAMCMLLSTLLFTLLSNSRPDFQTGRELARRDRGRDILIVVQVALASVLFLGASLLLHSFVRLQAVDPGFDADKILTVRVNPSFPASANTQRVDVFQEVPQRLERLPEVAWAGATNVAPFSGYGTANRFRLDGESNQGEYRSAAWRAVTPNFFRALGVPLKRGRLFTDADRDGSLETVILSESMAKRFWPAQDPIGRRLLWGKSGNPKTIVGIVGDLRDTAVDAVPVPTMFRPFAQLSDAPMTLVIRTKGDPITAIEDVRREIRSVDENAAIEFQPLRRAMANSILRPRISLTALGAFAVIAMITAAFGLYGLIGYRVNQRQQEIGIRLALGCSTSSVRWSVQRRCLALVTWGLALGLPIAYALSSLMRSLLYETQPAQPAAYGLVLIVFITVALAASYGPARRASRMDPAAAIRHE
jgi:putative ABC transport system permease protein